MILKCNRCGAFVSTRVPDDTVVRAWIKCTDCMRITNPKCRWTFDEQHAKHKTACGHGFQFIDDGVQENGFTHCPFCGRWIEEETE